VAKKKAARKTRRNATKDLTGATFKPEVDDEVVLAFQPGALRAGAVLGNLWDGSDKPA
jgi:Type VI secretion system/phage-baseplate injector OB domain